MRVLRLELTKHTPNSGAAAGAAVVAAAGAAAGAGRQSTSLFYFLSRLIITSRIDVLKDNTTVQCNRGFF